MKTINIADASAAQLRHFAGSRHGIDVPDVLGRDKVIAKLRAVGFEGDTIEVEEDAAPVIAVVLDPNGNEPGTDTPAEFDPARRMVKIIIPAQDDAGGSDPVYLSVNHKAMLIARDTVSLIPYCYREALKHAQKAVYTAAPNGGLSAARMVPQYPFSDVA